MGNCVGKSPGTGSRPESGGTPSAPPSAPRQRPAPPHSQDALPSGTGPPGKLDKAATSALNPTGRIFDYSKHVLTDDYTIGEVLGQGAFGVVKLATSKADGATYACKTLSKARMITERDVKDCENEVDILLRVKGHVHIVAINDVYEDKADVHVIMELCSGGELFDRIVAKGHYTEQDAAGALRTMLNILKHCHENNILHRDLKPENFLLDGPGDDALLKLTDFGLSVILPQNTEATDVVGTPVYIAPEVLRGKYSHKADVWSCGCILYILLSGKLPFFGQNEREELRATLAGVYDISNAPWPSISDEAKEVVKLMLTMNVEDRPSAAALLSHPWVKEDGIATSNPIGEFVIQGMKQLQNMNKLKRRALQVMAQNMAPEDIKKMEEIFKEIDTDKSGTITVLELKEALLKSGKILDETELQEMLNAYDVDGDGVIDYSEFMAATSDFNKLCTMENMEMAFKKFDIDGDGEITPQEVQEALKDCGIDEASVLQIVSEADRDGDGKIQYSEFVDMMKSRPDMAEASVHQRRQISVKGL